MSLFTRFLLYSSVTKLFLLLKKPLADQKLKQMNKTLSKVIFSFLPAVFILIGFLYVLIGIQPELIFHHNQPAFIVSSVFVSPFLKYPGGLAELATNFIMQAFYYKVFGAVVFFTLVFIIGWIMLLLINSVINSNINRLWAFIPIIFSIALANNYNFPFSIIVSVAFLVLMLFVLQKTGKGLISSLCIFTIGAVAVYWFAGSGFMLLFSASSFFVSHTKKSWQKVVYFLYIPVFAFIFPILISNYWVAVPLNDQYFYYYPQKVGLILYELSVFGIIFLLCIPILLAAANTSAFFQLKGNKTATTKPVFSIAKTIFALLVVISTFVFSHIKTYNHDAKKIIQADYFCFNNNAEQTANAAKSTYKYNFSANLNYNLVMSKTDKLTDNFFGFMQIKGNEALHPDIDFATELSFISADFYYNLGFISEARHWAYETLVYYPYSLRAMQNLVKIHLVLGEYKAAERTLKTLEKGFIDRDFVKEYMPYIIDTTLIQSNSELMEKRSFIPAACELNHTIEGRFRELLEANSNNKNAYEFLMLYYLTNADFENFMELYKDAGKFFEKIPAIYEEAILMNAERNGLILPSEIKISAETQKRFNNFMHQLEQYKGKTRLARNSLYPEFGKTYMYFLKFVYPNIIETEIISDEGDYPSI